MYPDQVHDFLLQFFKENNCPILSENDHYVVVQLTEEMDKKLMNRPYYWQYVEATGTEPSPMQLTFITDKTKLQEDVKGEVIHFGSNRLKQMFKAVQELGSFVHMYEKIVSDSQVIFTPWLGVNYKVTYYSDQTKETFFSLGLNLMTGIVREDFHDSIKEISFDVAKPDNVFNLPYIIKPLRGLERLDAVVDGVIANDDHTWAEEAKDRLQKSLEVLEYFYEGVEDKPECHEMEKKALEEQYAARVGIEIINGGLFYMK